MKKIFGYINIRYFFCFQDKEELTLKRLKADAGDKDGSREADVRKSLNGIMHKYGLVRMEKEELPKNNKYVKKTEQR